MVKSYKISDIYTYSFSISYRGWGALGFPITNSDFPPQTSDSTVYFVLVSHPNGIRSSIYLSQNQWFCMKHCTCRYNVCYDSWVAYKIMLVLYIFPTISFSLSFLNSCNSSLLLWTMVLTKWFPSTPSSKPELMSIKCTGECYILLHESTKVGICLASTTCINHLLKSQELMYIVHVHVMYMYMCM